MKQRLPIILITLGFVIAAISYFGYQAVNKKSDIEVLQETMYSYINAEANKKAALTELGKKIIDAPAVCDQVKALLFFGICDLEPYEGQPVPAWNKGINTAEQDCVVQAFHATNEHAFKFTGDEYQSEVPTDLRVINFGCDVTSVILFDDNISYDDPDASASELLESFYRERAGTRSEPKISY